MEATTLHSTRRDTTGKGPNRRLRSNNQIPAIAYGHGFEAPISLTLDPHALAKALTHPKGYNTVFPLAIEGESGTREVLVREVQRHPLSRAFLHVDLIAPDPKKEITAMVPLNITGKSVGVSIGGKLQTPHREVKVKALPKDIPAVLTVDITPMEIGAQFMASQLETPEGVSVVFDRDYALVRVAQARGVKKATTAEDDKKKKKK